MPVEAHHSTDPTHRRFKPAPDDEAVDAGLITLEAVADYVGLD